MNVLGLLFKGDKEKKITLWLARPLDEEEAEHLSERHPDFNENQTLILFLTLRNREFACYAPSIFISILKLRKDLRSSQQHIICKVNKK